MEINGKGQDQMTLTAKVPVGLSGHNCPNSCKTFLLPSATRGFCALFANKLHLKFKYIRNKRGILVVKRTPRWCPRDNIFSISCLSAELLKV
jgi:hypothetical protein